jgi:hypothetical protein
MHTSLHFYVPKKEYNTRDNLLFFGFCFIPHEKLGLYSVEGGEGGLKMRYHVRERDSIITFLEGK